MLYSFIKPLLFAVDAELAHEISLEMLQQFHCVLPQTKIDKPTRVMGLDFPNAVGLAAGLDKNADYLDGLSRLGFGFIEVGSVTPKAQAGNAQPRLFRITKHQSILNRMGFNNSGVDHLVSQVRSRQDKFILGINIGKNLNTAVDDALLDYQICFEKVYPVADYIVVNISSPNTPGLRQLQNEGALEKLLQGLEQSRKKMEDLHQYSRPMAVKVAPDLDQTAIPGIADLIQKFSIDGLVATNTTLDQSVIQGHHLSGQAGGLSGSAVREKSRRSLELFYAELKDEVPIISVGGIDSADEAKLRFELGAKLVQIYSGLIYRGPGLVKQIASIL
ncbi:MAG: dihydroorotate dehydrogenase [Planctomycetota bacterium]|jgi:dihydroorotate dehydrogenase